MNKKKIMIVGIACVLVFILMEYLSSKYFVITERVPEVTIVSDSQETKLRQTDEDLIKAITEQNLEAAIAAINAGANVNVKNDEGIPVIHLALYNDLGTIALMLISSPDFDANIRDWAGQTPLHIATDIAIVKELIARGADVNAKERNLGMTPIFSKELPIAKLLVKAGADIHARSVKGNTPLIWYTYSGYLEGIEYLVSQGADVNAVNDDGQSALEIAETFYHPEIMTFLKSVGGKKFR